MSSLIKSYNFSSMSALPEELSLLRSGGAWYQDDDGYFHHETESNRLRFGSIYGSARGALVEISITANNLYARPSSGTLAAQLSAGLPIAEVVTDTDTPCKNLSAGQNIWEFDNSGGGGDVDIEWAGTISSGRASAMAYIKTLSGSAPTLTISGNGSQETGHSVDGYTFHKCEDRSVSGAESLRITVAAGSIIRVACVNFQAYDVITSFIDTVGTAQTRNEDDLNGNDVSWWSGVQQGTIFIDFTHMDDTGETAHIFEVRDSDLNDRFTIWHTSGLFYTTVKAGGDTTAQSTQAGLKNLHRIRMALSYQDDQFIQSCNGFVDFTDNSGLAPDTTAFTGPPLPLSFLSVNRSGAAPLNGIIHGFALYGKAMDETSLNKLTTPNQNAALWVGLFGDSNLERWNVSWSGRPQQRFEATLQAVIADSHVANEGKSGSTANYAAAQLLASDWWSGSGDSGGGNIYVESLARNAALTKNELRNFDYAVINHGANDLRKISTGDITVSAYKASLQNVIDLTIADYGPQVKLIMQNLPSSDHPDYTESDMQAAREAMAELAEENAAIIASYESYDLARIDYLHADEDGCNTLVDRAANIILSHMGLEQRIAHPQALQASYNGNTITINTDSAAMSGTDPTIFYVEVNSSPVSVNSSPVSVNSSPVSVNSSPVSVNSSPVSGSKVTLVLDSVTEAGDTVRLWIGYGQMAALNAANCVKDTQSGYPLRSAANITVSEA
jgi:hypothetical protein